MNKKFLSLVVGSLVSLSVSSVAFAAPNFDPNAPINKALTLAEAKEKGLDVQSKNNTAYINGKPVSASFLLGMLMKKTVESERYEKYAIQQDGQRISKDKVVQPGMTYYWHIEGTTGATMERIVFEDNIPFHVVTDINYMELDESGNVVPQTIKPVQFNADSKDNVSANLVVKPKTQFRIQVVVYVKTDEDIAEIEGISLQQ